VSLLFRRASAPRPAPPPYGSARFARRFDQFRRFLDHRPVLDALEQVAPLAGARVVELGAGTGVLTEPIAQRARVVVAADRSPAMLAFARRNLDARRLANVRLLRADHRRLPLADRSADLVLSAFAFDGLVHDAPDGAWSLELDGAVREMLRLRAPGGAVAFLGSPLGRPNIGRHLEQTWGFRRRVFLVRWRFPSRRLARAAVRLFFGRRVWLDYAPHWPRALVTFCGLWWVRPSSP